MLKWKITINEILAVVFYGLLGIFTMMLISEISARVLAPKESNYFNAADFDAKLNRIKLTGSRFYVYENNALSVRLTGQESELFLDDTSLQIKQALGSMPKMGFAFTAQLVSFDLQDLSAVFSGVKSANYSELGSINTDKILIDLKSTLFEIPNDFIIQKKDIYLKGTNLVYNQETKSLTINQPH